MLSCPKFRSSTWARCLAMVSAFGNNPLSLWHLCSQPMGSRLGTAADGAIECRMYCSFGILEPGFSLLRWQGGLLTGSAVSWSHPCLFHGTLDKVYNNKIFICGDEDEDDEEKEIWSVEVEGEYISRGEQSTSGKEKKNKQISWLKCMYPRYPHFLANHSLHWYCTQNSFPFVITIWLSSNPSWGYGFLHCLKESERAKRNGLLRLPSHKLSLLLENKTATRLEMLALA